MTNLKNLSKRGLALFLALVMCLGMLNLTAFAAEDEGSTEVFTCGLEEHTHTAECYGKAEAGTNQPDAADGSAQGHQHTSECYGAECVLPESEGHTHVEGEGYTLVTVEGKELDCSESTVGHIHTSDCYTVTSTEQKLTCTTEETAGHTHDDSCYTTETVTKYRTETYEEEETYTYTETESVPVEKSETVTVTDEEGNETTEERTWTEYEDR